MAQEKVELPKFKGKEDEFCTWWLRARAYAGRFGFKQAMSATVEANLPANEGPGANQDEQNAVERNVKAADFLTTAMPDSMLVLITAAGLKDTNWPTQPKAHLMVAYLQSKYQDTTALAGVGAKRDLESCTMDVKDNPTLLFEKLVGVQFKYQGNAQAVISENDLITQAIQALPTEYTSTVAALIDAERRAGRAVTLEALRQAASDYFSVAMKGKEKIKVKEIEGGLVAADEPHKMQGNIKKVIEETIQCTIREFRANPADGYGNYQPNQRVNGPGTMSYPANGGGHFGSGAGMSYGGPSGGMNFNGGMNYNGQGGVNYNGQGGVTGFNGQGGGMSYGGLGGGANYGGQGGQGMGMGYGGQGGQGGGGNGNGGQGMNYGVQGVGVMNYGGQGGGGLGGYGPNVGGMGGGPTMITPEIMMAMIQATKAQPKAGDTSNMLCYNCGQVGHRSNDCRNPKNLELVTQVMTAQGRKPCNHCGKFGHPPHLCWNLPSNAGTRPEFWRGPILTQPTAPLQIMPAAPPQIMPAAPMQAVQPMQTAQMPSMQPMVPAPRPYESGQVSVDQRAADGDSETTFEFSLAIGHLDSEDMQSVDASLKAMGLSLNDPSVWIGDTGATTHNTAYIVDTVNHRTATAADHIVGVTGPPAEAKTIVDIPCQVVKDGAVQHFKLKDVAYVPSSRYNLFSLTKLMANGWSISGDAVVGIKMSKGDVELKFDKTVHTPKGVLYVIVLHRRKCHTGEVKALATIAENEWASDQSVECGAAMIAASTGKSMTINKAHVMCGHMGHVETKAICDYFGQPLTKQGYRQCTHCGKAKAKQLAVAQRNEDHVVAGPEAHRIFMDISSVKHGSEKKLPVSKPFWLLIVVEFVNFKVSEFLKRKSDLPEVACNIVRKLQMGGVNIKYVRMDNAGENVAFAQLANSKDWSLRLSFEFTGAGTPQRNYLVEIGFSTLWGRLRAMFDAALVPEEEKYLLVREGVHHLTFLDGLIVYEHEGSIKTKYGWIFGSDPKITLPLRVWGAAGIVKVSGNVTSKLEMRGEKGMFVGYALDSSPDTYRMYLPDRNSIHVTRDVQWSKRMFYEPEKDDSIHAADSVVITMNRQNVPLRTVVPATAPAAAAQTRPNAVIVPAMAKGPVAFQDQVEYVPQGFNFEESLDEEDDDEENMPDLVPGQVAARVMTPSVIEIGQDGGEDCSMMSSSIGKTHTERAVEKEIGKEEKAEEEKAGESVEEGAKQADHGGAADDEGRADFRSEKERADGIGDAEEGAESKLKENKNRNGDRDNGRVGGAESKLQAATQGVNEDNRDTYSEVDSQAFADDDLDDDFEDDDAFIERLSQMVDFADLVDNEGAAESHVEDRESGNADEAD